MSGMIDALHAHPWLAIGLGAAASLAGAGVFTRLLRVAGAPGGRPGAAVLGGVLAGVMLSGSVAGRSMPNVRDAVWTDARAERIALSEAQRAIDRERLASDRLGLPATTDRLDALQATYDRRFASMEAAKERHRGRVRLWCIAWAAVLALLGMLATPMLRLGGGGGLTGVARVRVGADGVGQRERWVGVAMLDGSESGEVAATDGGFSVHRRHAVATVGASLIAGGLITCIVVLLTPLSLWAAAGVGAIWVVPGVARRPAVRPIGLVAPSVLMGVAAVGVAMVAGEPMSFDSVVSALEGTSAGVATVALAAVVVAGVSLATAAWVCVGGVSRRVERAAAGVLWGAAAPGLIAFVLGPTWPVSAAADRVFVVLSIVAVVLASDVRWLGQYGTLGVSGLSGGRPWVAAARPVSRGGTVAQVALLAALVSPYQEHGAEVIGGTLVAVATVECLRRVRARVARQAERAFGGAAGEL
jgi:hypothetical protein